jgi:hypothetical protein
MGWVLDGFAGHEGFLVGLVVHVPRKTTSLWRELSFPFDADAADLQRFAVGCYCGWRSPHLRAQPGVRWEAFAVEAPRALEDIARAIWRRHVEALPGLSIEAGGLAARDLLDAGTPHAGLVAYAGEEEAARAELRAIGQLIAEPIAKLHRAQAMVLQAREAYEGASDVEGALAQHQEALVALAACVFVVRDQVRRFEADANDALQ